MRISWDGPFKCEEKPPVHLSVDIHRERKSLFALRGTHIDISGKKQTNKQTNNKKNTDLGQNNPKNRVMFMFHDFMKATWNLKYEFIWGTGISKKNVDGYEHGTVYCIFLREMDLKCKKNIVAGTLQGKSQALQVVNLCLFWIVPTWEVTPTKKELHWTPESLCTGQFQNRPCPLPPDKPLGIWLFWNILVKFPV